MLSRTEKTAFTIRIYMAKNSILIFLLLWSQFSYGVCNDPVTYLNERDPAPCKGYLFTEEKEAEVREIVQKYPKVVELNNKYENLINKLNDQVDLNRQLNANLKEQMNNRNNQQILEKVVYFSLGLIIGYSTGKFFSNR